MKIKATLSVTSSNPDVYGNRYHMATVTNTKNGKSLTFITGTERNLSYQLMQMLGGEWGHVTESYSQVPVRHYNRLVKGLPYEHNVNIAELLGVKEPVKA